MPQSPTQTQQQLNLQQVASQQLWLKDLIAWIENPSISMYGRWNHPPPPGCPNCPGEGGVDLAAPVGTPVYALGTGPLLSADTFASQGFNHPGSVVSQRVNVPGVGPEDIYYQHVDLLPNMQTCLGGNCEGRVITAGEQIGTVGSAGETEVGFNPNWGSLYGPDQHPGPWPNDPRPWIAALITQSPSAINAATLASPGQGVTGSVCDTPVVGGLVCWLQQNIASWAIRIGLFLLALVLVILGGVILIHPDPANLIPGVRAVKSL